MKIAKKDSNLLNVDSGSIVETFPANETNGNTAEVYDLAVVHEPPSVSTNVIDVPLHVRQPNPIPIVQSLSTNAHLQPMQLFFRS